MLEFLTGKGRERNKSNGAVHVSEAAGFVTEGCLAEMVTQP
ncbi:hypothetical protein [Amycolatopsis keratiniphila]|nr:hypothetical protein [Amycolatopsis keratiniphila]